MENFIPLKVNAKVDTNAIEEISHIPQNSTNSSVIDDEQLSICNTSQYSESTYNELYDKLRKLNENLLIKPLHWTDEYWDIICKKYPWFLYKDEHAGCNVCLNVKVFMGKKTLLSLVKLFIMNLSYEEFEHKLAAHNVLRAHQKSLNILVGNMNDSTIDVNSAHESQYEDISCPLCQKTYKFKKRLSKHVQNCFNENNKIPLNLPCNCSIKTVYSLRAIDDHCSRNHLNCFFYRCKFCFVQISKITDLYDHLLILHDFQWNPYLELPNVEKFSNISDTNSSKEFMKNRTYNSEKSYNLKDINNNQSNSLHTKKPHTKRFLDETSQKTICNIVAKQSRIMNDSTNQELPRFSITLSSIVHCNICEGRYLSQEILDKHTAQYHPDFVNENCSKSGEN